MGKRQTQYTLPTRQVGPNEDMSETNRISEQNSQVLNTQERCDLTLDARRRQTNPIPLYRVLGHLSIGNFRKTELDPFEVAIAIFAPSLRSRTRWPGTICAKQGNWIKYEYVPPVTKQIASPLEKLQGESPVSLRDLVLRNRSYRRFYQDVAIDLETLRELIDLARCSASGSNRQPLKYVLSCDPSKNAAIFPLTRWAGFLRDWPGPAEGERPSAYIIILGDTEISKSSGVDHGIAAQSIMLGATEKGLGGCMIGSIDREQLRQVLDIPESYEILLLLALGKPKEKVVLEDLGPEGDIKYYRDEADVHHVPKRALDDIIIT